MKMSKINSLFLGLILAGSVSLVNAQTTQPETSAATSQTANPTIESLKNRLRPIQRTQNL